MTDLMFVLDEEPRAEICDSCSAIWLQVRKESTRCPHCGSQNFRGLSTQEERRLTRFILGDPEFVRFLFGGEIPDRGDPRIESILEKMREPLQELVRMLYEVPKEEV